MRLLRRRAQAPEERGPATTAESTGAGEAAPAPGESGPAYGRMATATPVRERAPLGHEGGVAPGAEPARGEGVAPRGEPVAGRETAPPTRRRRGFSGRTRDAGAATAGAIGSGMLTLARPVMAGAGVIAPPVRPGARAA